jgi:outer membrane protein OmpA-like peptidoglycan-associated protein
MKYFMHTLGFVMVLLIFSNDPVMAIKGDTKGSADHPLISRYTGSLIKKYHTSKFDEYALLLGKVMKAKQPGKHEKLEGKITKISYEIPKERTTLEVHSNYKVELEEAGFEILFACKNEDCGGRNFNHTVVDYDLMFGDNYADQRYLAAKLTRPEGNVYVSLYVVKNLTGGGPARNRVYTQLDVIEVKPMETGLVTIDAEAMARDISLTGHVAVYGIYFDTDSAEVKRESKTVIDEIATLLKNNKGLKLFVVGHTDNVGTIDYNLDLSNRRAESVVRELIEVYGIKRNRLDPKGVGYLAPIASNKTEEGRSKNRRVELVEQ